MQIKIQILKKDSEVARNYGRFIIFTYLFNDAASSSEYTVSEDETSELWTGKDVEGSSTIPEVERVNWGRPWKISTHNQKMLLPNKNKKYYLNTLLYVNYKLKIYENLHKDWKKDMVSFIKAAMSPFQFNFIFNTAGLESS